MTVPFMTSALLGLLLVAWSTPAARAGESEQDFLQGKSKTCRSCALEKAALKRRDLAGADLTDARLTMAVLHRARLVGTIFAGAELSGANLLDFDRHFEVFESAYHWCRKRIDELGERNDPALAAILATRD